MTRTIFIAIVAASIALRSAAAPDVDNWIAAVVNDTIITFQDVKDASRKSLGALESVYGRQPALLHQKANTVMSEALEALVAKALIVDEFKNSVGVVPENMLDNQISRQIRKDFVDRENFRKSLRQEGVSFDKYRKMTHDDMVVSFMVERNVKSAIVISPQKIETYYTNHLSDYQMGNQVKLRMIVLTANTAPTMAAVKRFAQEIMTKLDGGAPFAELAASYSEGSTKRQGGDWGWIDNTKLRKGLSDVAFSLRAGERSGLIGFAAEQGNAYSIYRYDKEGKLTKLARYAEKAGEKDQVAEEKDFTRDPAGADAAPEPQEYYLMLVEDKQTSRTKTLVEVKDEIEKNLISEERGRLHKQWIDRLKAKAFVRYPST